MLSGTSFRPLVLSIVASLLVFAVLVPERGPPSRRRAPAGVAGRARGAAAAGVAALLLVVSPARARADNCGGLSDCWVYIGIAALVVAAVVVLIVVAGPSIAALGVEAGVEGAEITGAGAFLEGAGPWVAEGVNVTEGGAVAQSLGGSCVSACGEMLTGGAVSEAEFLAELGEWSNPGALADMLNAEAGSAAWQGGYYGSAADAVAVAQEGQTAATLQAPGLPGHMVVIEPGEAGTFLVRDPGIGGTYEVAVQWIEKWVSGGVWRL
jgi:hypothetical protein